MPGFRISDRTGLRPFSYSYFMTNRESLNEDALFSRKEKDGELVSPIPKDISEVGDVIRANDEKRTSELLKKLDTQKELFKKIVNQ